MARVVKTGQAGLAQERRIDVHCEGRDRRRSSGNNHADSGDEW
jgi:hypothetical protein